MYKYIINKYVVYCINTYKLMIGHWHYIRHCLIQISPIRKPSRVRPALLEVSSIRFRVVLSTFSFTGKGGASCASTISETIWRSHANTKKLAELAHQSGMLAIFWR